MSTADQRTVVVGVDGSSQALVAARYAVWQADMRGLDLVVVHAYPVPAMEGMPGGDVYTVLREAAVSVVDEVIAQLMIPPTMRVRTLLGQTAPVLLLRQAAESAALVVVGQDHVGFAEWLIAGNVAAPLCHRSVCPVVVVPSGWEPGPMNHHPVVVALDGTSATREVLVVAFDTAELLHTSVLAVHAMPATSWPRNVAAEERNVSELLAGIRQERPETLVSVRTVPGDPKQALAESSLTASVLVVGSPHADGLPAWTRSVARGVVKHAECPVIVVPRHSNAARGTFPQVA